MFIKLSMNKELIKKLQHVDKKIGTSYYTEYINFGPSKEFYEQKLSDYKKILDNCVLVKNKDKYIKFYKESMD